jgi:hypothetical protein
MFGWMIPLLPFAFVKDMNPVLGGILLLSSLGGIVFASIMGSAWNQGDTKPGESGDDGG